MNYAYHENLLYGRTPRELFECAMTRDIHYSIIQDQGYGIHDLYIGEDDDEYLRIVAVVGKAEEESTFDLNKIDRRNRQAIHFLLHAESHQQTGGLMEIDGVGFRGTDEYQGDKYLLFPENFTRGSVNLIKRLLDIFPEFLNRVYIDIEDRRYLGMFEGLGKVDHFLMLRELSVIKYMNGALWSALVENLMAVEKITMARESSFGDIEDNLSVNHLIIEKGSILESHRFIPMNYEILEVNDFYDNYQDIQQFVEEWRKGQKWNLKVLNLKFEKTLRTDHFEMLKDYLGGTKRNLRAGNEGGEMEFRVKNHTFSLKNAMDISSPGFSASYILTRKSFQFFSWESPTIEEIMDFLNRMDGSAESDDSKDSEDSEAFEDSEDPKEDSENEIIEKMDTYTSMDNSDTDSD